MKYSLDWISEHVEGKLPPQEELVDGITMRAFEIEELVPRGTDLTLDIKVLPNRAHDALSHRGMAREIIQLFSLKEKKVLWDVVSRTPEVLPVRVVVEDNNLCPRYMATPVSGVVVSASPEWLKSRLESVGQRSINNIVDITNFVLFDIGQPMHAFDADKVVGGITVRLAKKGETMLTLDNKALELRGSELVIADDEGVLALAGVKGGKKAEVDATTTNIIFESANFHPTRTRQTSTVHGIKTDASKRYENEITSAFAGEGMAMAIALIAQHGGKNVRVGETTDVFPRKEPIHTATISAIKSSNVLGMKLSDDELAKILDAFGYAYEKEGDTYTISIPAERLDLRTTTDLIEEIGRYIGFDAVRAVVPNVKKRGVPDRRAYYMNMIRAYLITQGFSEVYTYSFASEKGEVEVMNPVGKDRPYMRNNLTKGLRGALVSNTYYSAFIGIPHVRIFEFGNVFTEHGERMHFALALTAKDKQESKALFEFAQGIVKEITDILEVPISDSRVNVEVIENIKFPPYLFECDLDATIALLPEPTEYAPLETSVEEVRYRTLSNFPFVVRDIALFVPANIPESEPENLIRDTAGDLVVRFARFDKFQKPGEDRISYAYRLVFQSFEKTLTDEEVNAIMQRVTTACEARHEWEVR